MDYYTKIKDELINNEVYKRVKDYSKNRNDLKTYYNVGKLLIEAQGGEKRARYGDNLIKEYSIKLMKELGKGYTISALKRMRQFYILYKKGATLSHQLTWSHYVELLKFDDINKINYYIGICISQKLSIREFRYKIKNNEYERLPEDTKKKLSNNAEPNILDFVKNPIIVRNNKNYEMISEKILQKLIIENIENFLEELGTGFTFIKSEYPIKLGDRYNYIDLLLYNIEYNCYVVVELKITELKKEHVGQIQVYMNYVDETLKKFNQNKTIGIVICKQNNKYIIKYCSDDRIIAREYNLV